MELESENAASRIVVDPVTDGDVERYEGSRDDVRALDDDHDAGDDGPSLSRHHAILKKFS